MKKINLKPSAEKKIKIKPSTEKKVDPAEVAKALGAEIVGEIRKGISPHLKLFLVGDRGNGMDTFSNTGWAVTHVHYDDWHEG